MFVVHMKRTFNIKIFNTSQQVRYKSNLVIIGAGWGGFRLARDINKEKYDVTILSPRNHFLFTPLLPSTSVGTLEFRCVQGESWRTAPFSNYERSSNHLIKCCQCCTLNWSGWKEWAQVGLCEDRWGTSGVRWNQVE